MNIFQLSLYEFSRAEGFSCCFSEGDCGCGLKTMFYSEWSEFDPGNPPPIRIRPYLFSNGNVFSKPFHMKGIELVCDNNQDEVRTDLVYIWLPISLLIFLAASILMFGT